MRRGLGWRRVLHGRWRLEGLIILRDQAVVVLGSVVPALGVVGERVNVGVSRTVAKQGRVLYRPKRECTLVMSVSAAVKCSDGVRRGLLRSHPSAVLLNTPNSEKTNTPSKHEASRLFNRPGAPKSASSCHECY